MPEIYSDTEKIIKLLLIFLNLKIRHYIYLLYLLVISPSPSLHLLHLEKGMFPTQGSNPGLPHCKQILYQLSHKGSPRILEWVAYPFCRGSSWSRNQTRVSCIAGRFFINWAMREAQLTFFFNLKIRPYIYLFIYTGNLSLSITPPSLLAPPSPQFVTHITIS